MSIEYIKFINTEVYDLAAKTGCLASTLNVEKTQISNILETFEAESNTESAVKMTIAFIARQIGRGELKRELGITLINDLKNILKKFESDEELRNAVRKYLYLFKWFNESKVKGRVNSFDDFLQRFVGRG